MYRISELIGLPVLALDSGEQIGEVQDIVVDIENTVAHGILIQGETWLAANSGILFTDVFRIGRDAVMLRDPVIQQNSRLLEETGKYRAEHLVGRTIYTETGLYLGVLSDIFFQAATGELTGYEVSDGIIADFLFGRKTMPLPQAQIVHSNRLLVPESMSKLLHDEQN